MLVELVKFIHVIFALSLLGGVFFSLVNSNQVVAIKQDFLLKLMLIFCLLTMLTGTFLVLPRHFTYHTPWIIAAYSFVSVAVVLLLLLLRYKKIPAWLQKIIYLLLIAILIAVAHDAISKATLLHF